MPEPRPGLLGITWKVMVRFPVIYVKFTAKPEARPKRMPYNRIKIKTGGEKATAKWAMPMIKEPIKVILNETYSFDE